MAARAARFVGAVEAPDSSIRPGSLDYSPESLEIVDGLLGDLHTKGVALPEDVQVDVSAYIFEVARREFGGRYLSGDDENPFVLMIGEPDFQLGVMVMSKVAGRVANGPEDNIPFFYAGIAPPVARRKSATQVRPRRSPDRNKYGRGGVRTCDLSRVKRGGASPCDYLLPANSRIQAYPRSDAIRLIASRWAAFDPTNDPTNTRGVELVLATDDS